MPTLNYICSGCNKPYKFLLSVIGLFSPAPCIECGQLLKRATASSVGAQVIERIDTGTAIKALERPAEAERMAKERSLASKIGNPND